ncbi:MAG: YraN family protein [Chitinophagales bacterium]
MAKHNDLGKKGEDRAYFYLKNKAYKILERNYKVDKSEIDIIAEKDKKIVFIEVKTRTSIAFGNPESFLSSAQKNRIIKLAAYYLEETQFEGEIRFDIIAISKSSLVHLEDAFFAYDAS